MEIDQPEMAAGREQIRNIIKNEEVYFDSNLLRYIPFDKLRDPVEIM